ncbi:MAG: YidC/Oxa1 family membrane protein insertase [Patescibacteria group bacterium]|nr:YidC/Oxa1 family membrane protein insertase [Patescibacteria group bacterium]
MFEFFTYFFDTILYKPLLNALILLYQNLPGQDFGVAIIALTVLIKLALYPLSAKGIKAQKALSILQPKMKEIQEKFKNNKEEQAKVMMELYKKEKVNPFSGCLPLLIQLPIIIALYRVFWNGFKTDQISYIYDFISFTGPIDPMFLNMIDLSQPYIALGFLAGILQFFQTKMTMPEDEQKKKKAKSGKPEFADMMQKQMLYFFPVITVIILWTLPSAIGLYWITFTLFAIVQQHFTLKQTKVTEDIKKI